MSHETIITSLALDNSQTRPIILILAKDAGVICGSWSSKNDHVKVGLLIHPLDPQVLIQYITNEKPIYSITPSNLCHLVAYQLPT